MILILATSVPAYADIVSLDSNFIKGQTEVVDKLNRDRTALANSINNVQGVYSGSVQSSGQIKAHTVGEENMYADASPRQYLADLFIKNLDDNNGIVASGLVFNTATGLTASATPGVAYTMGYRVEKTASTPHTFSADKWTYTFACQDGSFDYLERNIGINITTSEYPTNCQPLSRVSTDSTSVIAVKDLRKLKFTFESYDSVYDDSTESSAKDLFVANGNSLRIGANLRYLNASSYTVTAGSAMINGEARDRVSFDSDPAWPVASTSAQDGLDQGVYSNGTYYVYLVADENQQRPYTVVHSVNANGPTGKTNYLKIGEFYTMGGTISKDSVISYTGTDNLLGSDKNKIKAWANINMAGAVYIRASNGVSSVTDNGVGDVTISFTDSFTGTNYATLATTGSGTAAGGGNYMASFDNKTANSVNTNVTTDGGAAADPAEYMMIAIGEQA